MFRPEGGQAAPKGKRSAGGSNSSIYTEHGSTKPDNSQKVTKTRPANKAKRPPPSPDGCVKPRKWMVLRVFPHNFPSNLSLSPGQSAVSFPLVRIVVDCVIQAFALPIGALPAKRIAGLLFIRNE
jgi:hypothetical protein